MCKTSSTHFLSFHMSSFSEHVTVIVEQISQHHSLILASHERRTIYRWFTQEGDRVATLQSVTEMVSTLDDRILALKVAEVIDWAITDTNLSGYNVTRMVYDKWEREMLC